MSAGGAVNISAQENIFSSGTGTQISTPGSTVLKVQTGSVGSPSTPLVVSIGGQLHVYAPPNEIFIAGSFNPGTYLEVSTTSSPSTYGESVTFTATISDPGGGAPTGSVEFYDGTTDLGPGSSLSDGANSATSTFTTSSLPAGVDLPISAVYTATGNFTGSSGGLSLTVDPAVLTITADNETKVYGGSDPTLTYTVMGLQNGDPSSVVSGVSLSTATGAAATAGTHTITISGGTAANYAITDVNGTLTVSKAPLSITADNQTKVYGAADPVLTYTPSGTLYYSDTYSVITGVSLATATGAAATAGTHTITITGGTAANYAITDVNGTLTVSKASLTVTADNQTKVYGAPDPVLTYTPSGTLYYSDTYSVISGVSLATATGAAATAGTHTITISGGTAANYAITDVNGTLTVSKAPLLITAVTNTKAYDGTTSAAAIPIVSGLQYTDTVTNLSETYDNPAVGTGKPLTVATYTVDDGDGGKNYTVTTVENHTGVIASPELEIHTEPSASVTAGQVFATEPVIYVEDQNGNLLTGDNTTQVTALLRVGAGPLLGTTTVTVSGGIATFANLADDKAGTIILLFTAPTVSDATSSTITVNPAAATRLSISAPATAAAGSPFTVTVTALDPYNNVATGFQGTVYFASTDARATLPHLYTFTSNDAGAHTFGNGVTLRTSGTRTITITDVEHPSVDGSTSIDVGDGIGAPAVAIGGNGGADVDSSIGALGSDATLATSSAPSADEYQAVVSPMDERNLYANALIPGSLRTGLVADSVLDDLTASLLLPPGQDERAPAGALALPLTGVRIIADATGPGSQQDQNVLSAASAAGLIVFGPASGPWFRRSGIFDARK